MNALAHSHTCRSYREAYLAVTDGRLAITLDYAGAHLDRPVLAACKPAATVLLSEKGSTALWWAPTDTASRQLLEQLPYLAAAEPGVLVVLANEPEYYGLVPAPHPGNVRLGGPDIAEAWGPRARATVRQWLESRSRATLYPSYASTSTDAEDAVGLGPWHRARSVEDALALIPYLHGNVLYLDFPAAPAAAVGPLAAASRARDVTLAAVGQNGHWYAVRPDGSSCWIVSP